MDKVLDIRRVACQSVGGIGDRYTVHIQEKEIYYGWNTDAGLWLLSTRIKK